MEKSVIGIGEILWDMLPEGKKLGGAPANFAYHTAQLGLPAYIVSAVGNDHLGDEIIQHIEQKQLNHLIPHVPYPTGTVEVKSISMKAEYPVMTSNKTLLGTIFLLRPRWKISPNIPAAPVLVHWHNAPQLHALPSTAF